MSRHSSNDNASPQPHDDVGFEDSLAQVIQGAKIPAKKRGASIKPAIEVIVTECYEKGVLPDTLRELIDLIITPSYLDQASLNSIIRNLYPVTAVESDVVIKVVGCLGHGALKPSLGIQAALLRWLLMVHHVLEKQDTLAKAYSVLFNLLDTAAIRPQLCHLLALITRRRHVRPYRIQALLSLGRQAGNDPFIVGLLRVYKDYYPEIVAGDVTRGKASAFRHPDPLWRERLGQIQHAHAQSQKDPNQPQDAFRVFRQYGKTGSGRGANIVPEVHTSHAQEKTLTLEEIENVDGLVRGLETIQLPNQLVSVLADPLLQKLMLLRPDYESHQRVSNWIISYAQDLLSGENTGELQGFLEILHTYVSTTKNTPPAVLSFLDAYLKIWNGRESKEVILSILAYAPLPQDTFNELYSRIFSPVESKVLQGSPDAQLEILACYTGLLRHWTSLLLSRDKLSIQVTAAASELIQHVNRLCLTILQTSSNISAHSIVLDFYEQVAHLSSNKRLSPHLRFVFPPPSLVYILHFSSSPATASRLYNVLVLYKAGFQGTPRTRYTMQYINEFNGFLMDICNCLWRSRAFNAKDTNAHACLIADSVITDLTSYVESLDMGINLASLFTLTTSPALGMLATTYLRELEDEEMEQGTGELDVRHAGPVTKTSLAALARNGGVNVSWDEYRQGILEYLERHSLSGARHLMENTMTTLNKKA
ncbi:Mis6-domain-containing protein [Xylariales sp. PMI_506]|nr:Mis6-domain-containing protein [Xylariales sp. PMI_506]